MDRFVTKKPRLQSCSQSEQIETLCEQPLQPNAVAHVTQSLSFGDNVEQDNGDNKPISEADLSCSQSGVSVSPVDGCPVGLSANLSCSEVKSTGKRRIRKFCPQWLTKWTWLDYAPERQAVFCTVCKQAKDMNMIKNTNFAKDAFLVGGFQNWKKATERFLMHESSEIHRTAASSMNCVSKGVNIMSSLSLSAQREMAAARQCLLKLLTSITFLAGQGLAMHGKHDERSNFNQLLILRAADDPALLSWLNRTKYKWMSHDIQNDMLELLSDYVLRKLCVELRAQAAYAVMVDETTDCSHHEQMAVCIRLCTSQLEINEVFVGFYELEKQDAATLLKVVLDILLRLQLDIGRCRGQCYDGAANVAGHLHGLQMKVRDLESRALFVHCAGHTINLVVQDAVANVAMFRDGLLMFGNLISFVRDSPKRMRIFERLQMPGVKSLRPFCPTRWVLKESALATVLANYTALQEFLKEISDNDKCEAGSKAAGFHQQLNEFQTFFCLKSLNKLFGAIGTVNEEIQSPRLHLAAGFKMISDLKGVLLQYRDKFPCFWVEVVQEANELDIDEPVLARPRRLPRRLDGNAASGHVFTTPEDYYRVMYFGMLDAASTSLDQRFDSETWDFLGKAESALLVKGASLTVLRDFYKTDLNPERLKLHIDMLHDLIEHKGLKITSLSDLVSFLKDDEAMRLMLPQVVQAVQLLLTVPLTTCTAERSFSQLRRLKTYLRTTMTQSRLNHTAILNCHSDMLKDINFYDVADDFILRNTVRRNTFAVNQQ